MSQNKQKNWPKPREKKKGGGFLFYCHLHLAFIMFLPQAPAGLWGSQQWFGL